MQLGFTDKGNVRVVSVPGDITFRNSEAFQQALVAMMADKSFAHVVVDLAAVGFLNSSAIGSLVWLHNQTNARKGRIVLAKVQPDVRRLLVTTRLDVTVAFLTGGHAGCAAPAAWAQETCPPYGIGPRWHERRARPSFLAMLAH